MERTGVLRRLIHTAGQIAALGYEARETEVERTLEQAEAALFAVRRSHLLGQARSPLLRDALSAMFERLEQVSQRRGTLTGVPTGFTDLDRLLTLGISFLYSETMCRRGLPIWIGSWVGCNHRT